MSGCGCGGGDQRVCQSPMAAVAWAMDQKGPEDCYNYNFNETVTSIYLNKATHSLDYTNEQNALIRIYIKDIAKEMSLKDISDTNIQNPSMGDLLVYGADCVGQVGCAADSWDSYSIPETEITMTPDGDGYYHVLTLDSNGFIVKGKFLA